MKTQSKWFAKYSRQELATNIQAGTEGIPFWYIYLHFRNIPTYLLVFLNYRRENRNSLCTRDGHMIKPLKFNATLYNSHCTERLTARTKEQRLFRIIQRMDTCLTAFFPRQPG